MSTVEDSAYKFKIQGLEPKPRTLNSRRILHVVKVLLEREGNLASIFRNPSRQICRWPRQSFLLTTYWVTLPSMWATNGQVLRIHQGCRGITQGRVGCITPIYPLLYYSSFHSLFHHPHLAPIYTYIHPIIPI